MSEDLKICAGRCAARKSTKEKIFCRGGVKKDDLQIKTNRKVSVVGSGSVGLACAVALLFQKITNEIVLVDANCNLVAGEAMDLQHGSPLLGYCVECCTDYSKCVDSKIVIITAGARQQEGETRLDLIGKNVQIYQKIIPNLVSCCPEAVLLIVSNPCDVLTYVAWKLSGFPRHRVIGSGTLLDSIRFRHAISEKLDVSPKTVEAWIIGEHGDNSVALWSGVSVGNVRLQSIYPMFGRDGDPENWKRVHEDVVGAAGRIQSLKGYTNWAVGACVASIVDIVLYDKREIVPVSTFAKGVLKIEEDVTLSVPCVLGSRGILTVLKNTLSKDEHEQLKKCAQVMHKIIEDVRF